MLKKNAREWVDENEERLKVIARKIWEYAELALKEVKSSKLLADELESKGFIIQRGAGGIPTAFVATYGSGNPVIGIMGEYDALPGLSQEAVPQKKPVKEGAPGHGCGHNLLGTGAAGAAMAIKHIMEKHNLSGTVKFFGCPAEEIGVGKVFMLKAGLFDDVEAMLTWHPWSANTTWMASMLALNSVKFRFHGVAAHAAAAPEAGRSALDAVELMNVGVNYLREHIPQEARIHCVITSGGKTPNIVPDFAEVWYFVRAPKRSDLETIYNRILNIAKGAALMTETKEEIEFITGNWNVIPNKSLSDLLYNNLEEVGPPKFNSDERLFAKKLAETFLKEQKERMLKLYNLPEPERAVNLDLVDYVAPPADAGRVLAGSTDVGDVSAKVPTAQCITSTFVLGAALHSWQAVATAGMSIGFKGMLTASKVLALTGIDLLVKPEELKKAKNEFKDREITYKSPIPEGMKLSLPKPSTK
jgi:aminobenzoyl-glutamate utilization protein B